MLDRNRTLNILYCFMLSNSLQSTLPPWESFHVMEIFLLTTRNTESIGTQFTLVLPTSFIRHVKQWEQLVTVQPHNIRLVLQTKAVSDDSLHATNSSMMSCQDDTREHKYLFSVFLFLLGLEDRDRLPLLLLLERLLSRLRDLLLSRLRSLSLLLERLPLNKIAFI